MSKGKLFSRHFVYDELLLATGGKGETVSMCEKMSDYPQKAFCSSHSSPALAHGRGAWLRQHVSRGVIPKAGLAYCDTNKISRPFELQCYQELPTTTLHPRCGTTSSLP